MKIVESIIEKLGLEIKEIYPPQKGYRNSNFHILTKQNFHLNLIIYKNEPQILERIKSANRVSDYLAERGFPTRKTMSKIIRIKSLNQIRYACLYNYLEGETIPWEAYTMKHIKDLGKVMSDIHYELRVGGFTSLASYATNELYSQNERMKKYFNESGVKDAMARKLNVQIDLEIFERFSKMIKLLSELPNQQALHLDFVRSNILFKDFEITGIIDFEKAAFGHPTIDIARTLAFLIVDCKYKPEEKVRKYFLQSGYEKRGKSNLSELKFLETLLEFYWMYDFYKFLKHNPYESLKENEHYIRTINNLSFII